MVFNLCDIYGIKTFKPTTPNLLGRSNLLTYDFEFDVGLDGAVDAVGGAAEVGARVEAGHVQQRQLRPLHRLLPRRQHLVLQNGNKRNSIRNTYA